MKTVRKDGTPSLYGLACGYGIRRGDVSLFECDSHNVINVRAPDVWRQFYYCEYKTPSDCYNAALKEFKAVAAGRLL